MFQEEEKNEKLKDTNHLSNFSNAVYNSRSIVFQRIRQTEWATSPGLGAANSFSILAETTITNVPSSTISGDVGLSPETGANIGLSDPEVGGTIYSVDGFGPAGSVTDPALLSQAISAMMGNYTALDQPCTTSYAGVQDLTLVSPLDPGVYCADAFILTGELNLSGSGVWIFKSAATLITSSGSIVSGGGGCSVWWRLGSSADLGSNSTMVGNIYSGTSINMQTGASLSGRAFAQAAVTLDQNIINTPLCNSTRRDNPSPEYSPTPTTVGDLGAGVPSTGGAPLQPDGTYLFLAVVGGMSLVVLVFAIRKFRSINRSK